MNKDDQIFAALKKVQASPNGVRVTPDEGLYAAGGEGFLRTSDFKFLLTPMGQEVLNIGSVQEWRSRQKEKEGANTVNNTTYNIGGHVITDSPINRSNLSIGKEGKENSFIKWAFGNLNTIAVTIIAGLLVLLLWSYLNK